MKTFTILGTGWLGLELAKSLRGKYKLKVSSRTEDKISFYNNLGFNSYLLNEENLSNLDELLKCEYLFINFPPSKFNDYLGFLDAIYLNEKINLIEKIIFISSTSIYPKENGIYDEDIKIVDPSSKIVYEVEKKVKNKTDVIFRCAGLFGGSRIAGKVLSKKEIKDSNSKVNHLYRDDVILAIEFVIQNNIDGIYNLCAPFHPTKSEVYKNNSIKYNFESPIFLDEFEADRLIDGSKITKLGFNYKYQNPLEF